jgi:HK97 gp10 family phage protein
MIIKIVIPKFHAAFVPANVRHFLKQIGDATRKKLVTEAAAPKSGRVYQIGGGRTYRASAPGEFPANKHGLLAKSYGVETTVKEVTIGTNAPYARFLWQGTHKMKPRKFLREALEFALEHEHMTKPFAEWRKG